MNREIISFGPYRVTEQVFYHTTLSYALVNIKPILPGHVLVVPFRPVPRLTQLDTSEVTDLFTTVQKVQQMLARVYFSGKVEDGSFNIAIQDGPESGQTVPHLHCHIIPRTADDKLGDAIYGKLQGEEGNIGGGFFDSRPEQRGKFPQIEDANRMPRSPEDMRKEADFFREQMALLDE